MTRTSKLDPRAASLAVPSAILDSDIAFRMAETAFSAGNLIFDRQCEAARAVLDEIVHINAVARKSGEGILASMSWQPAATGNGVRAVAALQACWEIAMATPLQLLRMAAAGVAVGTDEAAADPPPRIERRLHVVPVDFPERRAAA